jgi:hypothetical protein
MLHAHTKVVDDLIQYRSTCLLNKSRWTINFVDSLVHQSPFLITSKNRGQTFPLEIWELILEFVIAEPNDDDYTLVIPRRVEPDKKHGGGDGGGGVDCKFLICDEYEQQDPCGIMEGWSRTYTDYLHNPGAHEEDMTFFDFRLPQATGKSFAISMDLLQSESKPKFLFFELEARDLISFLEGGDCQFCSGERYRDTGTGHWVNEILAGTNPDYHKSIPCPFCIGAGYAHEGLDLIRHEDCYRDCDLWDEEAEQKAEKEWDALHERVNKCKKKLGYL